MKTDNRTLQELETVEAMMSCNQWEHYRNLEDKPELLYYQMVGEGESLENAAFSIWVKRGWTQETPF